MQVPTFAPGAEHPGTEHLLGISDLGEAQDAAGLAGLAAEGRRHSRGASGANLKMAIFSSLIYPVILHGYVNVYRRLC